AHREIIPAGARWVKRMLTRVGGVGPLRHGARPVTFVMHNFMDARDVAPAWSLLRQGIMSDDPRIRATQERLQACSYHMAHPDTDELVPACAQHAVYDPAENRELITLLDPPTKRRRA
ncbi:MAG: radical SAM domain-containing protein, partial [Acidimicrobiales bacterium]